MAGEDRTASDHLSFLRAASEEVRRYGFFALLRAVEARAAARPRIGRSRLPQQNAADFGHEPKLDFPGYTLGAIEFGKTGRARIRGTFLGLTGPMGALPLHLSEYAQFERRYSKSRPFGDFLDLLSERMLQFFYRAWADSQPVAHADRPDDDAYAVQVCKLAGIRDNDADCAFPRRGLIHYASLLCSARSPGVIQDFLTRVLGVATRIREFIPVWRMIETRDRTQIGVGRRNNELGSGAVLGSNALIADDAFRAIAHCNDMRAYEELLPGGAKFAIAVEALNVISPAHLDWQLELEIIEAQVSGAKLAAGARLGWTSWLKPAGGSTTRADVRLGRRHVTVVSGG